MPLTGWVKDSPYVPLGRPDVCRPKFCWGGVRFPGVRTPPLLPCNWHSKLDCHRSWRFCAWSPLRDPPLTKLPKLFCQLPTLARREGWKDQADSWAGLSIGIQDRQEGRDGLLEWAEIGPAQKGRSRSRAASQCGLQSRAVACRPKEPPPFECLIDTWQSCGWG